jgi:hypothetical protein
VGGQAACVWGGPACMGGWVVATLVGICSAQKKCAVLLEKATYYSPPHGGPGLAFPWLLTGVTVPRSRWSTLRMATLPKGNGTSALHW